MKCLLLFLSNLALMSLNKIKLLGNGAGYKKLLFKMASSKKCFRI